MAGEEGLSGLSEQARVSYSLIVKSGSVSVDNRLDGIDELAELGLLQLAEDGDRFLAVDPRLVELELTSQWRQQAWLLQLRATALESDIAGLTTDYVEVHGQGQDSILYLNGLSAIEQFIKAASQAATHEILTAQPGGGRAVEVLERALPLAVDHLARGVALRSLYQHSARFSEPTKNYVREVTGRGGQIRTLDEFFNRLFIIDRQMVILPGNASRSVAVSVTDPAVVAFLLDVFERNWQRGVEFKPVRAALSSTEVVPDIHLMIKRLLKEGMTDSAIAKRIGVSERTYHSHLARIRKDLGAESRVQLGYLLAREDFELAREDFEEERLGEP
jgi:DNA-binding transcriptional ArsR family regulator